MRGLISKAMVIALIESKCTDGCLGTENMTLIDAYALIDEISEMPTAYDVDKVVEQITDLNDNEFTYARVVTAIKAGGVNED